MVSSFNRVQQTSADIQTVLKVHCSPTFHKDTCMFVYMHSYMYQDPKSNY